MRRAVLVSVLSVVLPASASAGVPTSGQIAWAHSIAVAYWHVEQPPCGPVKDTYPALQDPTVAAYAILAPGSPQDCTVVFNVNSGVDWEGWPDYFCRTYVHEFGHLVLGADYFASSNPSNPGHSPDPNSVMYGGVTDWATTVQTMVDVGCEPIPAQAEPPWVQPTIDPPAPAKSPSNPPRKLRQHRKARVNHKHTKPPILQSHRPGR